MLHGFVADFKIAMLKKVSNEDLEYVTKQLIERNQ